MPQNSPSLWVVAVELAMGDGRARRRLRALAPPGAAAPRLVPRLGVPSAAMVGSAGYALAGLLEFNEYGRLLFAFVLGYLGQAALHDLAVAILRHRSGLPPGGPAP
mgnify:CR=1 FL=1